MIVTDIDGTLVDNERQTSPRTKKILRDAVKMGIGVSLATGRKKDSAMQFAEQLDIFYPMILYNGAKIYDPVLDRYLYERFLDHRVSVKALEVLDALYPSLNAIAYDNENAYVREKNNVIRRYMEKDKVECIEVNNWHKILNAPLVKILVIGIRDMLDKYASDLRKELRDPNLVNSESNYLEILPEGVSKGIALKKLCNILNIPLSEVVAFGDNENDIEMLKYAGLGVAVSNANPKLKEVADYVTTSNTDEGVYRAVKKFIKIVGSTAEAQRKH